MVSFKWKYTRLGLTQALTWRSSSWCWLLAPSDWLCVQRDSMGVYRGFWKETQDFALLVQLAITKQLLLMGRLSWCSAYQLLKQDIVSFWTKTVPNQNHSVQQIYLQEALGYLIPHCFLRIKKRDLHDCCVLVLDWLKILWHTLRCLKHETLITSATNLSVCCWNMPSDVIFIANHS